MGARPANTYIAYVDPRYTQGERRQIGLSIVLYIVSRAKDGKGINNKAFKSKYSPNYTKTTEFKIADKSAGEVNLTLSGDMLDSLEVLDVNTIGRIEIGFVNDNESDKSVYLEEKGFKFLGLSDKELSSIVSDFGPPGSDTAAADIDQSFVENFVRGIFGR